MGTYTYICKYIQDLVCTSLWLWVGFCTKNHKIYLNNPFRFENIFSTITFKSAINAHDKYSETSAYVLLHWLVPCHHLQETWWPYLSSQALFHGHAIFLWTTDYLSNIQQTLEVPSPLFHSSFNVATSWQYLTVSFNLFSWYI